MKKVLITLLVLIFSYPAQASFVESCEYTANIEEVTGGPDGGEGNYVFYNIKIKILTERTLKGSHAICSRGQGTEMTIDIQVPNHKQQEIREQNSITMVYNYMDSLGPNGVVSRTSWYYVND